MYVSAPICNACYYDRDPDYEDALQIDRPPGFQETCAFCGFVTEAGRYVRVDTSELP